MYKVYLVTDKNKALVIYPKIETKKDYLMCWLHEPNNVMPATEDQYINGTKFFTSTYSGVYSNFDKINNAFPECLI